MGKRIIRGSFIGIFLGVVGAIAIGNVMHLVKISRNQPYDNLEAAIEEDQEEVFSHSSISADENCQDIKDVVLRFHVKANSNSNEDIELKYLVRDAILYEFAAVLEDTMTREETILYYESNLEEIEKVAELTIKEAGYDYSVKAYISNDYFPTRQYGEMVLPAGYYEALRVDIGEAKGENFWCILYPMMCYTIDSAAVISNEDGKELKELVGEAEYEKLFIKRDMEEDDKVEIRFKFLEWFGL
ncbi:MAG: hypothetical protein E7258_05960 [Lachnospiraceae bacterium]|nr:hypothetical protein [Lachnospiraceae bacterium]